VTLCQPVASPWLAAGDWSRAGAEGCAVAGAAVADGVGVAALG
jgi:hypothetical protein